MHNHPKLKPCFRAAVKSDGTLELLVYEEIGIDWWTGEGVTAASVKEQIDAAGIFSKIAVRINSPGGDAFEGVAIFNVIRAQGKPVNVFVDGIAASAASIVAMAGDTRTMGSGAMLMIHNAWSSCVGYAEDMRKMADTLDKVSASVASIYVERGGITAEKAKQLMDAESWLSGTDALELGLATALAEPEPDDGAAALALARSFKALKRLKKVPAVLTAEDDPEPAPEPEPEEEDAPLDLYERELEAMELTLQF
jgi:ATP-dependent protease ClpP protease subunit